MMREKTQNISILKNTLNIEQFKITSNFNRSNAPQNYPISINQHPIKKREESFKCENKKGVSNDKLTLITRKDRTRKMWSFKNVTFNE